MKELEKKLESEKKKNEKNEANLKKTDAEVKDLTKVCSPMHAAGTQNRLDYYHSDIFLTKVTFGNVIMKTVDSRIKEA